MQDFSTMAKQMQNIASPGKMPMPTMQGSGPMVAPGPQMGAAPPQAPGGEGQLMQIIQQIAQQIEAMTGVPATPEQIQMALSQVLPGAGAGAPGMAPSAGAPATAQQGQPMIPPQMNMRR